GRPAQRRDHPRPRVHPRGAGGRDPPGGARMSTHTISVLVEDKPGVLARISGLFSRRGFNIDSLAVGPTEDPGRSRMTIVVDCAERPLEQGTKQLNKLVHVLKIVELAEMFRAKIVDVGPDALTIEATGSPAKVQAMLELLDPYGIRELARTGRVALARGGKGITDKPLRVARPASLAPPPQR